MTGEVPGDTALTSLAISGINSLLTEGWRGLNPESEGS